MLVSGACAAKEPAAPAVAAPSMEAVQARRTEMAQAFAAQAAYCFARNDTQHPVFHGCVDWHSAAHGAWALASYQRLTGDARYGPALDAALSPNLLPLELAHLRADPSFETPYGRAWFLRLATAWRALHPDDERLDDLADEASGSLLRLYRKDAPDPSSEEYANASWALINLLHYARARGDDATASAVAAHVRAHFLEPRCDLALERRGFMSVCVTWAWLVSEVLTPDEFRAWYARWNPGLENLQPVRVFSTAHDYGRNFSRAWGLYHLAETLDDQRLRNAYAAHVAAGFEPQTQWRGDYMANGHWVAQFGMLAIEPLF